MVLKLTHFNSLHQFTLEWFLQILEHFIQWGNLRKNGFTNNLHLNETECLPKTFRITRILGKDFVNVGLKWKHEEKAACTLHEANPNRINVMHSAMT